MVKILKKKFRKISKNQEGIVLKPIIKQILKPIKIKPKLGRWCDCYDGRLPYPIECQSNKQMPISCTFKDGKKTVSSDRSICVGCKRQVEFLSWKKGDWDKIKEAIKTGNDLRDMDPPFRKEKI